MNRLLVTSLFLVLALAAGAFAIDAICVLKLTPTGAPECFTDANNPYNFDGTAARCAALATNGATTTYVAGETNPDTVIACNVGYCCQGQSNARIGANQACQSGSNSGSQLYSSNAQTVCAQDPDDDDTDTPTTTQACPIEQAPPTQGCFCGSVNITTGVCCATGVQRDTANECPTVTPTQTCGNRALDASEQCDAPTYGAGGVVCAGANQLCSATCTCVSTATSQWGDGICSVAEQSTASPDCTTPVNTCDRPQDFTQPTLTAAYNTEFRRGELIWTMNLPTSGCTPTGFLIGRSNSTSTVAPPSIILTSEPLSSGTRTYLDPTIPTNNGPITYTVIALYNGGTANGTARVTTPSERCPIANWNSCLSPTTGVSCTNYAEVATVNCTGSTMCVLENNYPVCKPKPVCTTCNGLFSMFPVSQAYCGQSACYLDLGNTSVEYYRTCSELNSCAGYRTQEACTANVCNRAGNCAWRTIDTGTGRGICGATIPELIPQTCGDCGIGGSCDANICEAIGKADANAQSVCAYIPSPIEQQETNMFLPDRVDGIPQLTVPGYANGCMLSKSVPCEYLATEEQCEGGSTYTLDVVYTSGLRTSGTNRILTRSNDIAGHDKCVWTAQNVCRRDADKNNVPDLLQAPGNANLWSYALDFTEPITMITATPGVMYPADFKVSFTNDSPIDVCFTRANTNCYPTPAGDQYIVGKQIQRYFQPSESGDWELRYYGMDWAMNLEEIKIFPFSIDGQVPVITVEQPIENVLVNITPPSQGVLRSRVTVRFTVSEDSVCTTTLTDIDGTTVPAVDRGPEQLETDLNAYGNSFLVTYPRLIEGTFIMEIVCRDPNGNRGTETVTIQTDSNSAINSPRPADLSRPYTNTSVAIQIQTRANAECRYGTLPPSDLNPNALWNIFTQYATTGGTVHQATVTTSASERYEFTTVCNISGIVRQGGPGDLIVFGIDRQAPETLLCNADSDDECLPISLDTTNSYRIKLLCVDGPFDSPSFGCTPIDTKYCVYQAGQSGCTNFKNQTVTDLIASTSASTQIIRYASTDRGSNSETLKERTIYLLDKTAPERPSFTITP